MAKRKKYRKRLKKYQCKMRENPTPSERRFAEILSYALIDFTLPEFDVKGGMKHKFKTQEIFANYKRKKGYIVDFYIPILMLVFEIDGSSHDSKTQKEYDKKRTEFLNSLGIKVVRYKNEETLIPEPLLANIKSDIAKRMNNRRKYIEWRTEEENFKNIRFMYSSRFEKVKNRDDVVKKRLLKSE